VLLNARLARQVKQQGLCIDVKPVFGQVGKNVGRLLAKQLKPSRISRERGAHIEGVAFFLIG